MYSYFGKFVSNAILSALSNGQLKKEVIANFKVKPTLTVNYMHVIKRPNK